jgi:hypothetical protein
VRRRVLAAKLLRRGLVAPTRGLAVDAVDYVCRGIRVNVVCPEPTDMPGQALADGTGHRPSASLCWPAVEHVRRRRRARRERLSQAGEEIGRRGMAVMCGTLGKVACCQAYPQLSGAATMTRGAGRAVALVGHPGSPAAGPGRGPIRGHGSGLSSPAATCGEHRRRLHRPPATEADHTAAGHAT